MPGQRHSQPTPTSLGQRYACLRVTCHLHFWHDRGLLRATVVTRGVERTPNKSQRTKLTLEKKILLPLLPGFKLGTCRSRCHIKGRYHTHARTRTHTHTSNLKLDTQHTHKTCIYM